jgi:hypothetical protein
VLVAATVIMTGLAVRNPLLLYHEGLSSLSFDIGGEMSSKVLACLSNIAVDWTKLVPSLSARTGELRNWIPLAFWLPAALGINLIWLKRKRSGGSERSRLALFPDVALVLLLGALSAAYRFFDVRLTDGFRLDEGKISMFAQDSNSYGEEAGGFWVRGSSRAFLVVQTADPISEFVATLSSPVEGETRIRVGNVRRKIIRGAAAGQPARAHFPSPRGLRWKKSYLYSLEVEEKGGFFPYKIDRRSQDRRNLGVYVRMATRFR